MKRFLESLLLCGFLAIGMSGCVTPRHTVTINNYVLLENGKQIFGKEKGLTAFVFENDQRKTPFAEFLATKYNIGTYNDISYNVDFEGYRFTVFLYDAAEQDKYFDMGQFSLSNIETEVNMRSRMKFVVLSMVNESNEDCLADDSLYKNIALKYLVALKDEFNRS